MEKEDMKDHSKGQLTEKPQEEHNEVDLTPRALDGGWGWMAVLGNVINHIVFGIVVRAFGVIYIELLERFKASATATSWIGAINMSFAGMLCEYIHTLLRFSVCVRQTAETAWKELRTKNVKPTHAFEITLEALRVVARRRTAGVWDLFLPSTRTCHDFAVFLFSEPPRGQLF